jgi:hypothetical protein
LQDGSRKLLCEAIKENQELFKNPLLLSVFSNNFSHEESGKSPRRATKTDLFNMFHRSKISVFRSNEGDLTRFCAMAFMSLKEGKTRWRAEDLERQGINSRVLLQAGILEKCTTEGDVFCCQHATIMDYYCAKYLNDAEKDRAKWLKEVDLGKHLNTVVFLAGLLTGTALVNMMAIVLERAKFYLDCDDEEDHETRHMYLMILNEIQVDVVGSKTRS